MHEIQIKKPLLEDIRAHGEENRKLFASKSMYVINLMSAPGAGKTSLLEQTLTRVKSELRIGVIEGDLQGSLDKDRLARFGIPVHQINTYGACHLDPRQVAHALEHLNAAGLEVLIIENVGNLVCPAEFDLGETDRVMLFAVTEGHDKPLKYPLMFKTANLLLVNKIDLLGATDFDLEKACRWARDLNPDLEIIQISCRGGEGLEQWIAWLKKRAAHSKNKG
jgi:hydrogenase nickel incorporation protein HypB